MTNLNLSNEPTHELDKNGPQTADELGGHPTLYQRSKHNLLKFNPLGNHREVWHTPRTEPEAVVRKWITTNEDNLLAYDIGKRELTSNINGPYNDAWSDMRDEYDWLTKERSERTDTEQGKQTCPLCGLEGIQNLPNHMRGCNG